jgi:hypothetical protein
MPSAGCPAARRSSNSGRGGWPALVYELTITRPPGSTKSPRSRATRTPRRSEGTASSRTVTYRNRFGGVHDITDPVQIDPANCGCSDRANSATRGNSSSPWGTIVTPRSAAHLGKRGQQVTVGAADIQPGPVPVHRHGQMLALGAPGPLGQIPGARSARTGTSRHVRLLQERRRSAVPLQELVHGDSLAPVPAAGAATSPVGVGPMADLPRSRRGSDRSSRPRPAASLRRTRA